MTTLDYANFPPLGEQTLKPSQSPPVEYRFPASPVLENDERDGSDDESVSPQPLIESASPVQHNPTPALQEEAANIASSSPFMGNSGMDEERCQDLNVVSAESESPAAVDSTPLVTERRGSGTIAEEESVVSIESSLQSQRTPLPPSRHAQSRKTPHHYKNHFRNTASRNHRNHSQSSSSMQQKSPTCHSDHAGYYYAQPTVTPYPPPVPPTPNQPRFVLDEYGQLINNQAPVPIGLGLGSGTAYGTPFCGFPASMAPATATATPNPNKNHAWVVNSPIPGIEGTSSIPAPTPRQSPNFRNVHPGNEYADYCTGGGSYSHGYPQQPTAYPDIHRSEGYYYNAESPYDAQPDVYGYYPSQSQAGNPRHMQPHTHYAVRNIKPAGNIDVGSSGGTPGAYHPNFYYPPNSQFGNPFARQNSTPLGTVPPAKQGMQPNNSRGNRRSSKQNNSTNGYSAVTSTFGLNSANRTTSRKNSFNLCGNGKAVHDQIITDLRGTRRFLPHENDEISLEVDKACSATDTPADITLNKDDAITNEESNETIDSPNSTVMRKCENPYSNGGGNEIARNETLPYANGSTNAVETQPLASSSSDRSTFSDSYVKVPADISSMLVPTPTAGGFGAPAYPNMRNKYPCTNIYIRGLAEDMTDEGLVEMCSVYGRIISSKAILEHRTGECRGFGFVMYADFRQARAAIAGLTYRGFQVSFAKCIPTVPSPRQYQNATTNSPSLHASCLMINTMSSISSASIPSTIHLHYPYLSSSPQPSSPRYPHHIPAPQFPPTSSPSVRSEALLPSQESEYGQAEEQQSTVLLDPIPSQNVVAGHFHPERETEPAVMNSSFTTTSLTAPITSISPETTSTSILPTDNALHNGQISILNEADHNPRANNAQLFQLTETCSPATVNMFTDGQKNHGMHEQYHFQSPAIVQQPRFPHPARQCLPLPPCSPVSASASVIQNPTRNPRFVHNQGVHGPRYNACSTNPPTSRFGNIYRMQESFGTKLKKLQDVNSSNLYLSNLPVDMTEVGLENLISPHSVLSCRILCDTVMGTSRGVGFARMRDREAALAVIAGLNGRVLPGSNVPLQVRFSDSLAQKKLKTQTLRKKAFNPIGRSSQGFRRQGKQHEDPLFSSLRETTSGPKSVDGNDHDDNQIHSGDECEIGEPVVATDEYPEGADGENTTGSATVDNKEDVEKEGFANKKETPDASVGMEKGQKPTMFFLAADGSVKPYPPLYAISGHDEMDEENLADKSRTPEPVKDLEGQVESLAIR